MGKPKVGERRNEFKYGMALYGVAWPEGPYYFVCGGGGHGLQNRIVWAQYKDGACTDQIGEYKLGEGADNCPMRMIMDPFGTSLLVGMASGGIRRLQISSYLGGPPKLVEVSVSFTEQLTVLKHEPSTMAFNKMVTLLAVGLKEGGGIHILAYPSLRSRLHWKLEDPEVKDLDFMHNDQQQLPGQFIASVGGDGKCTVWQLPATVNGQAGVQQLTQLELPKKLPKARFTRCRFARDGSNRLYTLINVGRGATHIAVYEPGPPGQPWPLLQSVQALDVPGSAFDISRKGNWLAAGDSDGHVRVFNTSTLGKEAEEVVSIAFVSGVVFNFDNTALISVGGDANCHVTDLSPRAGSGWGLGAWLLLTLAAALVFGLIFYYLNPRELPYWVLEWLQRQMSEEQRGSFLQQECSSGSSVVHKTVCSWVREAVALLPDKHYIDAWHDEL